MLQKKGMAVGIPICVGLCFVLLWQAVIWAGEIPAIVVPTPLDVLNAIVRERARLLQACGHTALAAFCGLLGSVTVGVIVALLFSQSNVIRTALYPYAILLQTIPIIALAPIVVIAVGRGFLGVVLISMIISVFPVITSTTTGLLQIDRQLLDLFSVNSATRWQELWKLRMPHAFPYLISGIRIASGSAIVGAIVGEFFVGSGLSGLGVLIERKKNGIETDELYAAVLMSALLGVVVFGLVTLLGDWVLKRFYGQRLGDD